MPTPRVRPHVHVSGDRLHVVRSRGDSIRLPHAFFSRLHRKTRYDRDHVRPFVYTFERPPPPTPLYPLLKSSSKHQDQRRPCVKMSEKSPLTSSHPLPQHKFWRKNKDKTSLRLWDVSGALSLWLKAGTKLNTRAKYIATHVRIAYPPRG